MVVGSVPMAFLGAYLLHLMGHAKASQTNIERALGAALLIGAAAMIIRYFLDRRTGQQRQGVVHGLTVRPFPTVLIGMVGGLIVGMTSVGSGSLMIVLLLFLYPMIGANQQPSAGRGAERAPFHRAPHQGQGVGPRDRLRRQQVLDLIRDLLADILEIEPSAIAAVQLSLARSSSGIRSARSSEKSRPGPPWPRPSRSRSSLHWCSGGSNRRPATPHSRRGGAGQTWPRPQEGR